MNAAPTACVSLLVALSVSACGPQTIEPVPDIPETVSYDTVKIDYGGEDGVAQAQRGAFDGPVTLGQKLVGDPSTMAKLTRGVVFGTNRTIYKVFAFIDALTKFPARHPSSTRWIWQGEPQGNYLYFQIDATDHDTFQYTLRWGNDAQDNRTVFTGWYHPLADNTAHTGAQDGEGLLHLDFDALHAYDPTAAQGQMAIAFRSHHDVRQVRVGFAEFTDGTAEPLSAIYRYVELPGGRGRLVFFAHGDFSKDGRPYEFLSVDANWLADHQGRVAARVQGGSVSQPVTVGECWDADQTTVWAHSQPTLPNYDGGSQDACAPALGALSLDAPTYAAPDGDPQVPGPHPSE